MKKLLSILGSVGMIGTAGATVVACGNTKTEETANQKLNKKINEAKSTKEKVEKEWNGPVPSLKEKLEQAIKIAETIEKDKTASKEQIEQTIKALNEALSKYELAMPQNIIAEAINSQKEDIKNLFSKNWNYSSFWNMNGEKDADGNKRIMDILYETVYQIAKDRGYEDNEITNLHSMVIKWSQDFVKLVYINVDNQGQQKIGTIIHSADANKTLEDIFLDNVKTDYASKLVDGKLPDDFFKDPQHAKLSLGIYFPHEVAGRQLNPATQEFWTFTFAGELQQDLIQQRIDELTKDGNEIEFHIEKGLDKSTTFTYALSKEFQKLFYGKYYFGNDLSLHWHKAPNDKDLKEGTGNEGWRSKNTNPNIKTILGFFKKVGKEHIKMFDVNIDYVIHIG